MGMACSTYGRDLYRAFWWENLRDRGHLEDPGINGTIILRWIFRKWDGGHEQGRSGSG